MNRILQPSTTRELVDISVTITGYHERYALCTIPKIKWVEQGALLACNVHSTRFEKEIGM